MKRVRSFLDVLVPAALNMPDAVKLLGQTLNEEKKTDETLTSIAVSAVNAEAA